jgi:hypothetical protein
MRQQLQRRLKTLELRIPKLPTEEEIADRKLQVHILCGIAFYLGNPDSEESLASAYARALGYSSTHEHDAAIHANDPDQSMRYAAAVAKLFEKFGTTLDAEWSVIVDALKRMEAGFSEHYRRSLHERFASIERKRYWRRSA